MFRRKIFEPHKYLGKSNNPNVGGGLTKTKKASLLQQLIIWTRGNVFIPDARVFWIKPSIRHLARFLKSHPEIDTIISTGPPHSMHLIARGLKHKFPQLKWVADFRDPWTEIDFYNDLKIGKTADRIQKKLEKSVLTEADLVISISQNGAEGLAAIGKRPVEVFTNGFIFPEFDPKSVVLDSAFTISHLGSMSFPRNPEVLWQALEQLTADKEFDSRLKIRLIGPVDFEVFERVAAHGLTDYMEHIPRVSHAESMSIQRSSQILLLVANRTGNVKGILTGKFFEYLGAKRPVLAIGQRDSDMEAIMLDTNAGAFVGYDDVDETVRFLRRSFEQYISGSLYAESRNMEQFASGTIAAKLIKRMQKLH